MENVCRTCSRLSKKFQNIFEHFRNNILISNTVMECTNIKVHKNDGLPLNICSTCLEKLNAAYEFRVLVIESDIKLRSLYNDIVKNNSQPDNESICHDLCLVKEENTIYKAAEADLLQKNNLYEPQSLEDVKTENISSNNYESDRQKTIETSRLIDENLREIDNISQDKHSIKMEENGNDQEYNSDLHNTNILTNSLDSSALEDCSSSQINLTSCEEGNQSRSMHEDQESDLMVHDIKLPLTRKEKNRKSVFCKECNRSFGYRYYVDIHMHFHTGNKPFKCDLCDKAFVMRFQLKNHKIIHSNDRPYSCEICGKGFKTLSCLRAHMIVHSNESKLKCEQCGKTFKYENSLKGHNLRHQNKKQFVCEICGKEFIDSSGLGVHKAIHRTEKNYPCPTCGKMFPSKNLMNRHLKQHSDSKPHVCNYCDRHFKDKAVLRKHVLIHTGEKPFKCNICSKDFRQASVLTLHMRTHTGETPYSCHLCLYKFKYKHHLRNHMKIHK